MKFLVIFLLLISSVAIAKPDAQVKLEASAYLLFQAKLHLERYIQHKDPKALAALTRPWGLEDGARLQKDLSLIDVKTEIVVVGNTMTLKDGESEIEIKVQDILAGTLLINGKSMTIQPYHSYGRVVEKLNLLMSPKTTNRQIWPRLLLPKANAAFPLILAAAARAVPAVGGFVAKHGKTAVVSIAKNAGAPAKWVGQKIVETTIFGTVATTVGACIWLGRAFNEFKCVPRRALCAAGFESDNCANSISDLVPEIQEAKKAGSDTITIPKLVNNDLCKQTDTGFVKDVSLWKLRAQDLQIGGEIPVPLTRNDLKIKYLTNPADPKKLSFDSITEELFTGKGKKPYATRVWKFVGEDFKVDTTYVEDGDVKSLPPTTLDCKKNAKPKNGACTELFKTALLPLGDKIDCRLENSEQVIERMRKANPPSPGTPGMR